MKTKAILFTEKEVEQILYNVQQLKYVIEKWSKENRLGDETSENAYYLYDDQGNVVDDYKNLI
jgi:hypothetical protein